MSFYRIKVRWAKKLLHAKYFVVLTDKESAIAIDGADPDSFVDHLALESQAAEVQMFYEKIAELVKTHNKALAKFQGSKNVTTNRKKAVTKKRTR